MLFKEMECARQFAVEHYEIAYLPEKAREVLSRFDDKAIHLQLSYELIYDV